ncbi:glycoside hydrolase family 61 protein [Thozetella sp. PMI_491]|nr:glycoside hydrolase family 61 protein [Thozetella sp. PMI_491]
MFYTIGGKNYAGYSLLGWLSGACRGLQLTLHRSSSNRVSPGSIQRPWANIDPLKDLNSINLRCNTPGRSVNGTAPVTAGSAITAHWQSWSHTHGPLLCSWMAKCPDKCSEYDGSGALWFKINEVDLLGGTLKEGQWGVVKMMNNGYSWTSTIPASLADGEYLLRHELIALHDPGKPQFYPECAQVTVSGGKGALPPENTRVSIPGVYNINQPSLNINVYSAQASQTFWAPIGPEVWKG